MMRLTIALITLSFILMAKPALALEGTYLIRQAYEKKMGLDWYDASEEDQNKFIAEYNAREKKNKVAYERQQKQKAAKEKAIQKKLEKDKKTLEQKKKKRLKEEERKKKEEERKRKELERKMEQQRQLIERQRAKSTSNHRR